MAPYIYVLKYICFVYGSLDFLFFQSTDDDAIDALSLAAKELEKELFSSADDSEVQVCFAPISF